MEFYELDIHCTSSHRPGFRPDDTLTPTLFASLANSWLDLVDAPALGGPAILACTGIANSISSGFGHDERLEVM